MDPETSKRIARGALPPGPPVRLRDEHSGVLQAFGVQDGLLGGSWYL